MNDIDFQSFLLRQPNYPDEMGTDSYFYDLACRLAKTAMQERLLTRWHPQVINRASLCIIGYMQDVIADAGIWRSFINHCRRLYGRTLPFFNVSDEYIDYELNPEDVRFLVWYALAMYCDETRDLSPLDPEVLKTSERWYEILNSAYEKAPVPEGYHLAHEVEIHAEEDSAKVMKLAQWVAHHCYLMTPADSMSVTQLLSRPGMTDPENSKELSAELNNLLTASPIGPLALFLREWIFLIIDDRLPSVRKESVKEEHKYYRPFVEANHGELIKIFGSYPEMNDFLINALGWTPATEHLSQLKGASDFILMVNPEKGMLVAPNIARCIKSPGNTLYDEDFAKVHAFDLLTVRGLCPADLLIYIFSNGWVPDAVFPGSPEDYGLVAENWDFIARCYLELYYRGD